MADMAYITYQQHGPLQFYAQAGSNGVQGGIVHLSCCSAVLCLQVLVRLEGTNITNCTAEHHLVATGGTRIATDVFYSDQELTVFMPEIRANTTTTGTLTQAPDEFLRSNDTFIVELKEVSYKSPSGIRGFFLCVAFCSFVLDVAAHSCLALTGNLQSWMSSRNAAKRNKLASSCICDVRSSKMKESERSTLHSSSSLCRSFPDCHEQTSRSTTQVTILVDQGPRTRILSATAAS